MKNLSLYDSVRFSFVASDGNRGSTRIQLEELGLKYSERKIDKRSSEFSLESDLNPVFIGILYQLFC